MNNTIIEGIDRKELEAMCEAIQTKAMNASFKRVLENSNAPYEDECISFADIVKSSPTLQQALLEIEREKNENLKNNKLLHQKTKFTLQFPNVSYNDLQKQNDNYSTDDGCIHYKHNTTNIIYSWNFEEDEWEVQDDDDQKSLYDLF